MVRFADKFKIETSRLKGWNYSRTGDYFITIGTYNKNNFLGRIVNGKIELKETGLICKQCILDIPKHFFNIRLVEWTIMPNHVHILFHVETHDRASLLKNKIMDDGINNSTNLDNRLITVDNINMTKETHDRASLQDNRKVTMINYGHNNHPDYYSRLNKKSNQLIPNLIKQFKSSVKREVNKRKLFFVWQERYYDEIITDEKKLKTVIYYIKNNEKNWAKDKLFSQ